MNSQGSPAFVACARANRDAVRGGGQPLDNSLHRPFVNTREMIDAAAPAVRRGGMGEIPVPDASRRGACLLLLLRDSLMGGGSAAERLLPVL